jgi:hypothetical protein
MACELMRTVSVQRTQHSSQRRTGAKSTARYKHRRCHPSLATMANTQRQHMRLHAGLAPIRRSKTGFTQRVGAQGRLYRRYIAGVA